MDDIYGDLENYNDLNVIDELRNENKDLQLKLDEYTATIDKLQKDYDKISSEFKKMEINYSSLLKTARAEVERKTQIITNLNMEKDMLVLNSIQNSNKNILNIRRNMARDRANSYKKTRRDDIDYGKSSKNNLQELKKFELEKERTEESRLPSEDTVTSGNTDDTNKFLNIENKLGKLESYNDKSTESKVKPRSQSIRNRRKSMPVLGKISSDEENNDNYTAEDTRRKDWHSREDKNRRDRNFKDNQSHKVSETSGIDEKYSSYHESSRETYYKTKTSRHSDKHRGFRDKYEQAQRHRRHVSPDKHHRRARDYIDEHQQRSDYGRHRVLDSPPKERYDNQRKSRDRRSNYERDNPYDDRHRHRYDKHPVKHKIQSDYDEPSKRARIDNNSHFEEERRWYKDNELTGERILTPTIAQLQHTSCQSPDYIHTDPDSVEPVREIMDTAATHLEDPRLLSKKYITKTEDNKVILSTVLGRDVNLKLVDTSTWDIKRIDIPEALRKPPEYPEEVVQELYMGIDNPVTDMSMESGELHSEANDLSDIVSDRYFNNQENKPKQHRVSGSLIDVHENQTESLTKLENVIVPIRHKSPRTKKSDKDTTCHTIPNDITRLADKLPELPSFIDESEQYEDHSSSKICDSNKTLPTQEIHNDSPYNNNYHYELDKSEVNAHEKQTETLSKVKSAAKFINMYKIPRINRRQETLCHNVTNDIAQPENKLPELTFIDDEKTNDTQRKTKLCYSDRMQQRQDTESNKADNKKHEYEVAHRKHSQQLTCPKIHSFRELVEGDLELSDETNDNVEMQKQVSNKQEPIIEKHIQMNEKDKKSEVDSAICKNENEISNIKMISVSEKSDEQISERIKKQKTKKKSQRLKSSKKSLEIDQNAEKKNKQKKETATKEIKAKFSDLFGDSSSLITPEDLGIVTGQSLSQSTYQYVPIFEDALDAIDINVKEVGKIQTRSTKTRNENLISDTQCDDTEIKSKSKNSKAMVDGKKRKTKKAIEETDQSEIRSVTKLDLPSNIKQTVNIGDINCKAVIKEPDVVNTVIISSGVQPQIAQEMCTESDKQQRINPNNDLVHLTEKNNTHNIVKPQKTMTNSALATSTPYKELPVKSIEVETESRLPESSYNCDSKIVRNEVSLSADQSSLSNDIDSQNDTDVPDVRIFVRRRKRAVKKTTPSK